MIIRNRFFKHFLPYFTLMGIIYITLRGASWIRYDYHRNRIKTYSRDEIKEKGLTFVGPTTLEEEYEKMIEEQDIESWQPKRIERPWQEEPDRP